jgi:NDP-sugar pyrophosphorylase family protein
VRDRIDRTFFVSNCDILIDQDLAAILDYHRENRNELTAVAALKHVPLAYGILQTGPDGILTGFQEKPEFVFQINSGVYVLEPHLLREIPANAFFHITQLVEAILARHGRVGVFPVSEGSWTDIGNWDDYRRAMGTGA